MRIRILATLVVSAIAVCAVVHGDHSASATAKTAWIGFHGNWISA